MMRIFIKKSIYIVIGLSLIYFVWLPTFIKAADLNDAFKKDGPLDQAAGGAGFKPVTSADETAEKLIGDIIQVILSFIGVIFLVLMIYGGYMWMLARGNEQQVEKAKQLITAAIIGVIIVLASFAISYFILQKFGQATLKEQGPELLGSP